MGKWLLVLLGKFRLSTETAAAGGDWACLDVLGFFELLECK
jgi:hypothetical protein